MRHIGRGLGTGTRFVTKHCHTQLCGLGFQSHSSPSKPQPFSGIPKFHITLPVCRCKMIVCRSGMVGTEICDFRTPYRSVPLHTSTTLTSMEMSDDFTSWKSFSVDSKTTVPALGALRSNPLKNILPTFLPSWFSSPIVKRNIGLRDPHFVFRKTSTTGTHFCGKDGRFTEFVTVIDTQLGQFSMQITTITTPQQVPNNVLCKTV